MDMKRNYIYPDFENIPYSNAKRIFFKVLSLLILFLLHNTLEEGEGGKYKEKIGVTPGSSASYYNVHL